MTMSEARALVSDPIWPYVRDHFVQTGEFCVYPRGDIRRLAYLPTEMRSVISRWKEALLLAPSWRTVVDGAKVRELKAAYPGIYPEVFRYLAYFPKPPTGASEEAAFMTKLLKLKFPEAYQLCCS